MVANDFLVRAAKAAAQAARSRYEDNVDLYHEIARAVLAEVAKPSPMMIDAAYEAVRFDEAWAINSRRDFHKALRRCFGELVALEASRASATAMSSQSSLRAYHWQPWADFEPRRRQRQPTVSLSRASSNGLPSTIPIRVSAFCG